MHDAMACRKSPSSSCIRAKWALLFPRGASTFTQSSASLLHRSPAHYCLLLLILFCQLSFARSKVVKDSHKAEA